MKNKEETNMSKKLLNISEEFMLAFLNHFDKCEKLYIDYMASNFPMLPVEEFKYDVGSRYVKIHKGGSVFSFIDTKNGDVLKPASWRAPAKHARGNIFDDHNGMKYISSYGPAYLK